MKDAEAQLTKWELKMRYFHSDVGQGAPLPTRSRKKGQGEATGMDLRCDEKKSEFQAWFGVFKVRFYDWVWVFKLRFNSGLLFQMRVSSWS